MNLDNFFSPKSIAVIGASSDKTKVGFALVSNLLSGKKAEIFPVNITEKEILGLKTYKSVTEIPEQIDLALIAVRADIVPPVLEECASKNIKNVIVISAGFKEAGEKGKELEEKIREIAGRNNLALLGPNCLGIINPKNNFNASFSATKPLSGKIAFLSQSGALGTSLLDMANEAGVGFSKFISLGNEASLGELEFLEYLKDDPDTSAILIYLEKLSDGKRFMDIASEITKTKPMVVLKAGRSSRGAAAVASHTGSLAPEDKIFSSACRQSGIIAVESIREFFNMAKLFQIGILEPLEKIVILTNGGGPSVVATDLIDLSKSLSLVEFSDSTQEELHKVLPPMAAVGNPVDIIGDALASRYEEALKIICAEKDTDAIILILTPQRMTETPETAKLLATYRLKKPIIPVFIGGPSIESGRKILKEKDLVNFNFPVDAIEALDNLASVSSSFPAFSSLPSPLPEGRCRYSDREVGENSVTTLSHPLGSEDLASPPLAGGEGREETRMLPFSDMTKILSDFGISLAGILAKEKSELAKAISDLGESFYAMKAISPDIIHKTNSGAVKLHIKNLEEAENAWEEIITKNPDAKLEGMLIQKMGEGKEVIIGMKRDPIFGPTILFGLGGIFTEILKDTSLRVAPIDKEEALRMIGELKGIKILEGSRGEKSVNLDSLADLLVKISSLSLAHPEIKEIDLNPVMATPDSAEVVDARFMV